jgi:hypothetical protein
MGRWLDALTELIAPLAVRIRDTCPWGIVNNFEYALMNIRIDSTPRCHRALENPSIRTHVSIQND